MLQNEGVHGRGSALLSASPELLLFGSPVWYLALRGPLAEVTVASPTSNPIKGGLRGA